MKISLGPTHTMENYEKWTVILYISNNSINLWN